MAVPHSGDTVGKYKLGSKLDEGAFGLVFIAHDTALDRHVALKFLRAHQIANPQILERFLQEARSAAKLSHPGIVTVHELGATVDGAAFIAMELLQGESLRDRLNRFGRLSPETAKTMCSQVASALQVAHLAGVIHRDLKPDNIFLTLDPTMPEGERIKVLDFGIAKLAQSQTTSTSIQTGSLVFGTPRYMSPEQCRSSTNVDHRADIYSLGCILYELICGRAPFEGTPGELILKHQIDPAPAARELAPAIPHNLEQLISRMLAKAPSDRPPTMEHVQRELNTGAHPDVARVIPSDSANAGTVKPAHQLLQYRTTLNNSTGWSHAPVPARRAHAVVTVSIALAGAAAGAIVVVTRTSDLSNAAPPAASESVTSSAESRAQDSGTLDMAARTVDPTTTKSAEVAPPITAHHLTPDSIAEVVRSKYAPELQNCYDRYARSTRNPARKLIITLHVGMTGQVVDYETNIPMRKCKAFENMRFEPEASTDDVSHRINVQVTFDYPPIPARSGISRPARVPNKCPAGMVWKPAESACVAESPENAKKCTPIHNGVVDPFVQDPCRR